MSKKILTFLLLFLGWSTPLFPQFHIDKGEANDLYAQHCASCHGKNLEGGQSSSLLDDEWKYGTTPHISVSETWGLKPGNLIPSQPWERESSRLFGGYNQFPRTNNPTDQDHARSDLFQSCQYSIGGILIVLLRTYVGIVLRSHSLGTK